MKEPFFIPVSKLNCNHCTLLVDGKCQIDGVKVEAPEKHYCFHIFKHFKEVDK